MEATAGRTEQGTESLRQQTPPKAKWLLVIDRNMEKTIKIDGEKGCLEITDETGTMKIASDNTITFEKDGDIVLKVVMC